MAKDAGKTDSELFIEYALRMTKGRIRLVGLLSAGLLILAVAAVYLLVMVVADHLTGGMPAGLILPILWSVGMLELGLVGVLILYPLLRRVNDLYAARLIEKAHPDFRNDLMASLQLDADRSVHRATLEAIRRRAAREVAGADVERSVQTRRVRLGGILFGAAAGALLVYCVLANKSPWVSLRRACGAVSLAPPTHTVITNVKPPSGFRVLTGRSVDFNADIRRSDGPAVVRISRDGGRTWLTEDVLTMREEYETPTGATKFVARWPAAAASNAAAVFRIECGDDVSSLRRLCVLPVPTIRSIHLTYEWPRYTGRGTRKIPEASGRVEALPGTVVTVEAEANLPATSASLTFEDKKSPPIIMKCNGRIMRGRFQVTEDRRYRITFKGEEEFIQGKSIWYDIKALADEPPRVRVTEPVERVDLAANGSLRLMGEAGDDYGLAALALVCKDAGELRRIDLGRFASPGVTTKVIDRSLPARDIGREGQRLLCHVEARDFRPPKGQVETSKSFELIIHPPDERLEEQAKAEKEAEERRKQAQQEC